MDSGQFGKPEVDGYFRSVWLHDTKMRWTGDGFQQNTAAPMGGEGRTTKEIESGTSSLGSTSDVGMEDMRLPEEQSWPSSSPSSFPSLSGGSPNMHMVSAAYSCSTDGVGVRDRAAAPNQEISMQPPHRSDAAPASSCTGSLTAAGSRRPTGETDDEAMTRAMVAVLSSSTSTAPPTTAGDETPVAGKGRHGWRAFKPYVPSGWTDRRRELGQKPNRCRRNRMIRALHCILRHINDLRVAADDTIAREPAQPTSNQLHHVISERKRRAKLNESIQALRSELPPGTRKDKASVLAAAKVRLIDLKARMSDLERKNKALEEAQLPPRDGVDDRHHDAPSTESPAVRVVVTRKVAGPTSGEQQPINGEVSVWAERDDVGDVALCVLRRLKEMEDFVSVESIAAKYVVSSSSSPSTSRRSASVTLQVKVAESEWDEDVLTEDLAGAVADAETTNRRQKPSTCARPAFLDHHRSDDRRDQRPSDSRRADGRFEQAAGDCTASSHAAGGRAHRRWINKRS